MSRMDRERQERLKGILLERKRTLWSEVRNELFQTLGKEYNAQFDRGMDLGDQSLVDLIEDTGLKVTDIRREELTRMDEAERRLAAGTYGTCEECGGVIPEERLALVPFAPCCVACQERREKPLRPLPGVTL